MSIDKKIFLIANMSNYSAAGESLTLSYDALDRLTLATTTFEPDLGCTGAVGAGNYDEGYSYDPTTGNLTSKGGQTLSYGNNAHPHAATAMGSSTYSYDANGNMVSRVVGGVSYSLCYDAENRLVGMAGGGLSATYAYDGDGRRVLAVVGARKTVYMGSYFEATYDSSIPLPAYTSNSPQPLACEPDCYRHYLPGVMAPEGLAEPGEHTEYRSYYYAGTMRLSMRVQGGLLERGGEVFHLLGDHLGSTSVTVSEDGVKVAEVRYLPWGEERTSWGAGQTDYGFTGQREAEAGLYFYQARWYDPALGRFAQADTMVPNPHNPQDWDRYAYTRNNPVRYTDPSGHWTCEDAECTSGLKYGLDNLLNAIPDDVPEVLNKEKTVQNFRSIRIGLIAEGGYKYVNRDGSLQDEILIAIIIALEFGAIKEMHEAGYGESIEALSEQFFSTQGHEQTPCYGQCSLTEQLIWLQTFQAMRTADTVAKASNFEEFLDDAILVMDSNYKYGSRRNSWVFGYASPGSELAQMMEAGQGKGLYYEEAYFFGGYWSYICSAAQNLATKQIRGW